MNESLKKVKPDKLRIPAQAYNLFVDAALDFRSRQHDVETPPTGGRRASDTIKIKNNSGIDVGRFQVLGIDGVVFSPQEALQAFQHEIVLSGSVPVTASHAGGRMVICASPIPNGTIGTGWGSGICPVQVSVTEESHHYAEIADSQTAYLASAESGPCLILWKETGTGLKWALIRFGSSGSAAGAIQMFYISSVEESSLTCYEAYYNGTEWAYYLSSSYTVLKYPSFDNMNHYKAEKYIIAIKVGGYWVSAYNQPAAFQEYT